MTGLGSRCRAHFNAGEAEQARALYPAWAEIVRRSIGSDVVHLWNAMCIERAVFEFADADFLRYLYDFYARYDMYQTYVLGSMDELRGNLALNLGLKPEARRWYERGLEWTRRERAYLDEGLCLQGLGDIALQEGHRAEARKLFSEAAGIFEKYGAVLYLKRASTRLAVLGGATSQATVPAYPSGRWRCCACWPRARAISRSPTSW
jgi:tetratricopeptide (TPR) repeat protein